MAEFGTKESGEALDATIIYDPNSQKATVSVQGTENSDIYLALPAADFEGPNVYHADVTVDLESGIGAIDTADYSRMSGETSSQISIGQGADGSLVQVITEQGVDEWDESYGLSTETISGAERIIGTPGPDSFSIDDCQTDVRSIVGGGISGEDSTFTGTYQDILQISNDIGPVEWTFDETGVGTITGQGMNIEFDDFQLISPRAGDIYDGERIPGQPPVETSLNPQSCDSLELSQFLRDAETALASHEAPSEMQSQTLAALQESGLADRVEAMAHGGVETVDVPVDTNMTPLEQMIVTADAAETAARSYEASIDRNVEMGEALEAVQPTPDYDNDYSIA